MTTRVPQARSASAASSAVPVPPADREVTTLIAQLRHGPGRVDPYPVYARLRELGPLLPAPWGAWLATDYATCARLLKDPAFAMPGPEHKDRQRPGWRRRSSLTAGAKSMLQLNPPDHTVHRSSVTSALARRALHRLRPRVHAMVDRQMEVLAGRLHRQGTADFAHIVADTLPTLVMRDLLGLPEEDGVDLTSLCRAAAPIQELSPTRRQLDAADRATDQVLDYLAAEIRRRRARPAPGLLSDLVAAEDRTGRPDLALDVAITLLFAGWPTTAATLNAVPLALGRHPDQAAWLRARPEAVPGAVKEIMRWDPPVHVVTRTAHHDTFLADTFIPAGTTAHALIGSAQRDPALRSRPQLLDFAHPPRHTLAFGHGLHHCVGAQLAQLEAETVLRALLQRFPDLHTRTPVRPFGFIIRDIDSLPVHLPAHQI
ncbi:cytochrome P450 [Spirillospora sp. NPDC127200]